MLIRTDWPSPTNVGLTPIAVAVARSGIAVLVGKLAKAGKTATTAESVNKAIKATAEVFVLFLEKSNLETPVVFSNFLFSPLVFCLNFSFERISSMLPICL